MLAQTELGMPCYVSTPVPLRTEATEEEDNSVLNGGFRDVTEYCLRQVTLYCTAYSTLDGTVLHISIHGIACEPDWAPARRLW